VDGSSAGIALHPAWPGIVLTVTEMSQEDIERTLCADTIDVGLAFTEILKEEVEWLPLHEERMALIVGQAHRKLQLHRARAAYPAVDRR
jgi:DNA-binding transcriptional LysR family regulator